MINKTLLLGAFLLMSALSIAQDRASIDSRIAEKEFALANATASSRQANESIKVQLIELYKELKIQLQSEIETISNMEIKAIKDQEIKDLNDKIASYSSKR